MTDDLAAQLAFLRDQRDTAPDAATRAMFETLIAEKEAQQHAATRSITTGGGDYAEHDVDKRRATVFVDGAGPLHQYFYGKETPPHAAPAPPFVAAEVSRLRQKALEAAYRQQWIEAADLLARLLERDPADTDALRRLDEARANLRLQDRYAVARLLRQDGEWQAVLGALDEIAAAQPAYPDPDRLRAWAEEQRRRARWEPRFGPVYVQVAEGRYGEAIRLLAKGLAADAADQAALQATVNLLADETLPIPARERVACGALLARYGDPRPGVCDLARMPFVAFAGGPFVIGNTEVEYRAIVQAEKGKPYGEYAEAWYKGTINQQATPLAPFELARYPVTNAQYQVFLNADGYNPAQPWWDAAARDWLARDDETTPDLELWQKRQYKDRPEFWDDARFGIARPNHPVVGINWYEAMAFCRWLTQHLNDGFIYGLPSELEWEYAARGAARRVYAWGNQPPDAERANFDQAYNGSSAVGCFPAGATPEGLLDMAGNVWEWTRSEYRDYPYNPADGREDGSDPAQKRFTVRGGGWNTLSLYLRASLRYFNAPAYHFNNLGIRLARHSPVKH